ncbi:hypothetical protein DESUT3_19570 [Desulfuromonas versatilis]|uniref:Uncharacterized protein n=1 Tax=Desulfuromonas versatilis TaxID=2802975 RepID=A0ABN6DXN5_9BACT|nr:hypothetical protein DESUT3_19570 [Desulfuromonas versatilis]
MEAALYSLPQAAAGNPGGVRFQNFARPDDGAIGYAVAHIHNHLGVRGKDVEPGTNGDREGLGDNGDESGPCLVQSRGERFAFFAGGIGGGADNDPGSQKPESIRPSQERPEQIRDRLLISNHAVAQRQNGGQGRRYGRNREFSRSHPDIRRAQVNGHFAAPWNLNPIFCHRRDLCFTYATREQ